MTGKAPTLRYERSFLAQGHRFVAGCDEVGRGALAGPVTVGLVVVDLSGAKGLRGVRDSKLLSAAEREALVPRIQRWALAYGVGHATAAEIDAIGLMAALRTAGNRAWAQVRTHVQPDAVILDGNHNWLAPVPQVSLFEDVEIEEVSCNAPVHTKIKADLQCLSVAAASVLAKVARDRIMINLADAYGGYGWEINKGYATVAHRAAIDELGASDQHRRTWRLGSAAPDMNEPAGEIGG
ncbi:ribonuclease HII [Arthrobacter sp. JZ12]|uniref:ribonuclease HII n=1 Tax=Arthrobacter sp. JZ12 TaxID=2654190 RepID=UPI002B48CBEF|nr:ribonuclease HII [Arthrobacter sp. JZ12]WRH25113.1 ribonuclease HII [Arthrobacter sp. JZ12]